MSEWWWAAVPVLCLLIDLRLGEPPARWHPVVWIGHYLQWAGERIAPRQAPLSSRPVAVPETNRLDGERSSKGSQKK